MVNTMHEFKHHPNKHILVLSQKTKGKNEEWIQKAMVAR
jgi:hypothetical protein